ncbi:MAG: hypothetical protein IJQ11_09795 [Bacteroidales bacterium]|nr:hypothetical protein [Bacteroidales bacterium]
MKPNEKKKRHYRTIFEYLCSELKAYIMIQWFVYYWLLVVATTVLNTKASSKRQGASPIARAITGIFAILGTLASLSQFVIAFWHMKWWMPITSLFSAWLSAQGIVSGIGALMVAKNWDGAVVFSIFASIIGVVLFGILSYIKLFAL